MKYNVIYYDTIHTYILTSILAYVHTYIHTYVHTHAPRNARTHTRTHARMHTRTQADTQSRGEAARARTGTVLNDIRNTFSESSLSQLRCLHSRVKDKIRKASCFRTF